MPERKYKAGDRIVYEHGLQLIITEVLPEGRRSSNGQPVQYQVRKPQGHKEYVIPEEKIIGLAREVDAHAIREQAKQQFLQAREERYDHKDAQAQAMKMAERYEGTPEGDKWLKLATLELGETINILDISGKVKPATFDAIRVGKNGRLLKDYPIKATFATGGTYRWKIEKLILEGETPQIEGPSIKQVGNVQQITLSAGTKVGTLAELQDHITALITTQNLDPNTPLLISDEDGNILSKLHNLQVEQVKRGKAVVLYLRDEKMAEEVYGT